MTLFFTHYVQRDWTMTVTTIKQNLLFTRYINYFVFTALHVPQPLLSFANIEKIHPKDCKYFHVICPKERSSEDSGH